MTRSGQRPDEGASVGIPRTVCSRSCGPASESSRHSRHSERRRCRYRIPLSSTAPDRNRTTPCSIGSGTADSAPESGGDVDRFRSGRGRSATRRINERLGARISPICGFFFLLFDLFAGDQAAVISDRCRL
jgi:hypothetical protein